MKLSKIPCWLRNGELYKSFEGGGHIDNSIKKFIRKTPEINSIDDFKEVYEISDYWFLKRFPFEIYVYAFHNKMEVLEFLRNSGRDGSLELIEDINNNKSIIKYKGIIQDDFKSPELDKFFREEVIDITDNKYLVFDTDYTARIAESDSYEGDFIRYTYDSLVEYSKSRNLKDLKQIKIEPKYSRINDLPFEEEFNVRPILIWDGLWSTESKKELNSSKKGIYIYNEIDLNLYIDDILKVLELEEIGGIIMFEKTEKINNINFLEEIGYCNLYDLGPVTLKYSDPPVNVLKYDSESG